MTTDEARRRFSGEPVARLATIGLTGRPHLVPIVFVLHGSRVASAVDAKPKRSRALRRLDNVAANPLVSLLVDHYENDWSQLWWVRADGVGRVLAEGSREAEEAIDLLAARHRQYRTARPLGPVLAIDVERWTGWSAGGGD